MNFAVVEYSSKSGSIWKHTDERPNYLADSQTEIDPTSFGCYVSALKGEHIPITWLAQTHFRSWSGNLVRKAYKRLVGAWPRYSLSYLKKFDTLLIVHQISDAHEVAALARRVRSELPHIFLIGVPTQPYGLLKPHLDKNPGAARDFAGVMNACHVFISIVKDTVPYYQKFSQTPVTYVPQPYPGRFASKVALPPDQKDNIIFVAGVTDRPNIAQGFSVAAGIQQQFPDYTIHITQIPGLPLATASLAGARYEIIPFEKWHAHLHTLSRTALVINTDYTKTRGRVQMDAAAVGTPALGGNSDAQLDLFPDFASTAKTPLAELIKKGSDLLWNREYYTDVVARAAAKLRSYSYERSAGRILDLRQKYFTA